MKNELKTELKELVIQKIENTRERLALKRIPFTIRTAEQHEEMLSKWGPNSELKDRIRIVGLAYAFLRGQRYWIVERRTDNPVKARWISAHLGCAEELVTAWLSVQPSEEERAAYELHLREAKERERVRRSGMRRAA